jgi:hypothetical protein
MKRIRPAVPSAWWTSELDLVVGLGRGELREQGGDVGLADTFVDSVQHGIAVSYEPNPSTRCSPSAETPFFCEVTNHTAANQDDSGEC